jgi:site-specific recombinase XerD
MTTSTGRKALARIVSVASEAIAAPSSASASRNPVRIYLASLSARTARVTMQRALEHAARILVPIPPRPPIDEIAWHKLRYQHIEALRTALKDGWSVATTNKVLTAVRQVLIRCRRLGIMSTDDCAKAVDVASVKGSRLLRGRALTNDERDALRAACDESSSIGTRDRAALEMLLMTGLRRSEIASLVFANLDAERKSLRIIGKGNKEREVPLNDKARIVLDRWLELRGVEPGPLFCRISRAGRLLRERALSPQFVYLLSGRLAGAAGVKAFSPHDLRRTFITSLLDRDVDIATVSDLVGHEQIETTKRYDRRGDKRKRVAVDRLS